MPRPEGRVPSPSPEMPPPSSPNSSQVPLRIVAIYSSGGRSVHALVRVDARTKGHWDEIKAAMMPAGIPINMASPSAISPNWNDTGSDSPIMSLTVRPR